MNNQAKLKSMGLEGKEKYYYLRFSNRALHYPSGAGTATVCVIPVGHLLMGDRPSYVRGVAFCSPKDQFVKKVGRAIALGRAIKALENGCSSDPISRRTPAAILMSGESWFNLSEFDITLTWYEQRLFEPRQATKGRTSATTTSASTSADLKHLLEQARTLTAAAQSLAAAFSEEERRLRQIELDKMDPLRPPDEKDIAAIKMKLIHAQLANDAVSDG